MIEHEAKILDIDEQDICEKLESIGAIKILDAVTYIEGFDFEGGLPQGGDELSRALQSERFKEITERILTLSNNDNMLEQGAYLRIREEGERTELIFKQNVSDSSEVKSEIEISVPIERSEWNDVAGWLEEIGLRKVVIQEKKRTSYIYEPYRYDIDTWPGVPTYLEVEASSQEEVMAAIALVGIAKSRAMSLTAKEVFDRYGIENPRRLIFSEIDT